jgi:hypothetical protein
MEELLRQAFQLGQQWVQDINNEKESTNFNEWYASKEVQEQVKNCSIPAVIESLPEHKCKYCGVMTTQPDEECYKAPDNTGNVL